MLTELFSTSSRVSIHAPLARSNKKVNGRNPDGNPFQYMLLLRGATFLRRLFRHRPPVSIHAPLARSNGSRKRAEVGGVGFNTCSSCEEQLRPPLRIVHERRFQYMLLLRGATASPLKRGAQRRVSIHAPLARSNRGNINRSGSKCKSKNRAKHQLSFVKEHYCILRFLIIV